MAALQERAGSFRVLFRFDGKQHTFTIGNVANDEAESKARQVEYLLMRLKQGLVTIPPGVDIVTFVEHDGNPPQSPAGIPVTRQSTTLGQLRDRYLETFANGTVEVTTLYTCQIHFRHFVRVLGANLKLAELTHDRLQEYINKRNSKSKKNNVGQVTIRKEIATLRAAWNWGNRASLTSGQFPNKGLRYPKAEEKAPFMTRAEIERQLALGGKPLDLWECLYLQIHEVEELLEIAKKQAAHPFIYPMFCMAAHTGARRSEILAAQRADFDFAGGAVIIHEKKRLRGRKSLRRVPLSSKLAEVMQEWFSKHPGGPHAFAKEPLKRSRIKKLDGERLTPSEAHDHFQRTIAGTRWECIRGWHVLRHSFVSACASRGTDQRLVQEWAGHMSASTSRRYSHLYPSTQQAALKQVFG